VTLVADDASDVDVACERSERRRRSSSSPIAAVTVDDDFEGTHPMRYATTDDAL
jgi:hypothetical protein